MELKDLTLNGKRLETHVSLSEIILGKHFVPILGLENDLEMVFFLKNLFCPK